MHPQSVVPVGATAGRSVAKGEVIMTPGKAACDACVRLEREKEAARKARDLSKVTDCVVLLRRHPDHGKRRAPDGRGRP